MTTESNSRSVVFFCTHHSGHINPILSLVPQYVNNGWNVHFFSDPARQSKIEKTGAVFHSIGDDVHKACMTTIVDKFGCKPTLNARDEFFLEEILPATVHYMEPTRGLLDRVRALEPSAIVSDVSALWGVLTAQLLNLPLITSCSCTLFDDLEPAFDFLRGIDVNHHCCQWLKQTFDIEYDAMCSYMNESDFVVSYSLPEFQPPSRQAEDHVHFFGAAMSNPDHEVFLAQEEAKDRADPDTSLLEWMDQAKNAHPDTKVIYCSLGTVVGQEAWTIREKKADCDMVGDFYANVFDAFGNDPENYHVIVSIGTQRDMASLPQPVPENIKCVPVAPQVLLLDRVDAFITHCGNNGVHEALFSGCPMICVPVFGDQHPNAENVAKLNTGVQLASPFAPLPSPNLDHVTSDKLQAAMNEIEVTRKQEIVNACQSIKQTMRALHREMHATGYQRMNDFIVAYGK